MVAAGAPVRESRWAHGHRLAFASGGTACWVVTWRCLGSGVRLAVRPPPVFSSGPAAGCTATCCRPQPGAPLAARPPGAVYIREYRPPRDHPLSFPSGDAAGCVIACWRSCRGCRLPPRHLLPFPSRRAARRQAGSCRPRPGVPLAARPSLGALVPRPRVPLAVGPPTVVPLLCPLRTAPGRSAPPTCPPRHRPPSPPPPLSRRAHPTQDLVPRSLPVAAPRPIPGRGPRRYGDRHDPRSLSQLRPRSRELRASRHESSSRSP